MTLRGNPDKKSLLQILLLASLLGLSANAAWAQDAADEEEEDTTEQEEAADLDRVVVTGSRLQRETYSSLSPLQIITAEGSREAGLINAGDILQTATVAGGTQIDLTFGGFVLDNGPGASTVDLRGMGAARTLVLLNGRRLAPSGVEGAPSAPDLNLVPSLMVRQYDVLLDGASSVYGSDAVAGVTNILLRKDYDGLEVDAYYNHPDHSSGKSYTVSAVYGMNFDRGTFAFGIEYQDNEEVTYGDRPWTERCNGPYEIDTQGNIRTEDQWYQYFLGMDITDCSPNALMSRVIVPFNGSIYYTPGYTNGGWPNFSEANWSNWFGIDGNGDGMTDVNYYDYSPNGKPAWDQTTLFPEQDRLSIMAYGEYTFEGDWNNTAYFEFNYNERDFFQNNGAYQFWPTVPANNPYNLCNPNAPGGVDCGLATDAMWQNPNVINQFGDLWGGFCASIGYPVTEECMALFGYGNGGPIGPAETTPLVRVADDRTLVTTTMEQVRFVAGLQGDLPFVDWGSMNNWVYDMGISYTTSEGTSSRPGIRGDRYDLAVGWYSSTHTPCENDLGYSMNPDNPGAGLASDTVTSGCVPVNMFAPSLYPFGDDLLEGDFATAAERDFLMDTRDFKTDYTQILFSLYTNGFLFELPGGTAMGGIGLEWREDEIDSIPDEVARDGLFWGFFSDGGAVGSKYTREVFGEIELPLLAGVRGAEELTVNLSARWTDDEFYDSDWTYSGKLGWRPIPSLLLRGTVGTSYRAPNLREVFLMAQTGFLGITDPCVIPDGAYDPISGEYNPDLDDRESQVFTNCAANGVDATTLDNNGFQAYSVEIATGGSTDIDPETSESFTYGFSWEQPWFEAFDFAFGMTYWETEIENTIIEPSAQFLVNDCYFDEQGDSTFCGLINRGPDQFMSLIDRPFINRDFEKYRGIDFNANWDQNFNIGSRAVQLGVDLMVSHQKEASFVFIGDDGGVDDDSDLYQLGYPEWKAQMGIRFNVSDFRWSWIINYIGDTQQDPDGVDDWDSIFGGSDTCFGPPDDLLCRDYADTDDYWLHSTSLYWYGDTWTVGAGIRNVFDEEPPRVDATEYWNTINGTPIGVGYDLNGRTYFFNVTWRM